MFPSLCRQVHLRLRLHREQRAVRRSAGARLTSHLGPGDVTDLVVNHDPGVIVGRTGTSAPRYRASWLPRIAFHPFPACLTIASRPAAGLGGFLSLRFTLFRLLDAIIVGQVRYAACTKWIFLCASLTPGQLDTAQFHWPRRCWGDCRCRWLVLLCSRQSPGACILLPMGRSCTRRYAFVMD